MVTMTETRRRRRLAPRQLRFQEEGVQVEEVKVAPSPALDGDEVDGVVLGDDEPFAPRDLF